MLEQHRIANSLVMLATKRVGSVGMVDEEESDLEEKIKCVRSQLLDFIIES